MALPDALAAPLRTALELEGFPASVIDDSGNINPLAFVSGLYQQIEIRTAISPPIVIALTSVQQGGGPNPFVAFLKPTVLLKSASSTASIAPYGVASDISGWVIGGAIILGLVGIGYALGSR